MSSTSVARHRARAFREGAETFDLSFGSPPAWQSALREYQERKPRRPPSKTIAIHESTDGPAILRRVFSEPIPGLCERVSTLWNFRGSNRLVESARLVS